MAGRAVFRAARIPFVLRALTALQLHYLRKDPDRLLSLMFREAPEADRAVLDSPTHRSAILQALTDSLPTPAYRNAIARYTQSWAYLLPLVTCPVTLHHGSADTWAPPAMSEALASHLPNATLNAHSGLGHYLTLYTILPDL